MSRPRYDWWSYVKGMIRRYPALEQEFRLRGKDMRANRLRELTAVRNALRCTRALPDGYLRERLVRLVLIERRLTIEGAALKLYVSARTARRYHQDFILRVAAGFGLLDGEG